ncbi:MAG: biopolymer transporter ExbD [Pirellulaceae bacterium]|nr:biopolymer transporter ExbD [Pirellulaceae bacterium]
MRLAKRSHGNKLDVNMTPMIDVTFLLLIFFMTVNQVSNVNKTQVSLPQLKGSQDQSEGNLTINVNQAGEIIVSANTVTLPQLISLLNGELNKVQRDAGRLLVVVRADQRGTCRTVNEVISTLVKLDITRVRIAVESAP